MVQSINIGQQHIGQVSDMVKELAAGLAPGLRVDVGQVIAVCARVEQFAHGPHIGDRHMAHFGIGDGGDELCGE